MGSSKIFLVLEFLKRFRMVEKVVQKRFEFFVVVQLRAQCRQTSSQFEELSQRKDLPCHRIGIEIFTVLEPQLASQSCFVVRKPVRNLQPQLGLKGTQDGVDVVSVHGHKATVRPRRFVSQKVSENSQDERQFPLLYSLSCVDVVGEAALFR